LYENGQKAVSFRGLPLETVPADSVPGARPQTSVIGLHSPWSKSWICLVGQLPPRLSVSSHP